jgi:hypothetical protein
LVMMSYTTGAASLVEPELDVAGVYKIHGPWTIRQLPACRDAGPYSPQTDIQTSSNAY